MKKSKEKKNEKKTAANWIKKAPSCANCMHIMRKDTSDFDDKYLCDKHQFATKRKAICDSYEEAEHAE